MAPGEALFELLGGLNITDRAGPDGGSVLQLLVEAIKDAVLLLAGEAAAAGRRSRSRASSFRLSEIGDSLEKAFRVVLGGFRSPRH